MTVWGAIDYGVPISGISGLTAAGTTAANAQTLPRKVCVFTNVPSGSGCILPSSYSSGTEIVVFNRGANALIIYPSYGDQIENYGVNGAISLPAGVNIRLISFDAPIAPQPHTWWTDVTGGSITPVNPGYDYLNPDNGFQPVIDPRTGQPIIIPQ